jgi:hypothetical protein
MTEAFFIAETFHSYGVIFFRIEKSFQDLLAGRVGTKGHVGHVRRLAGRVGALGRSAAVPGVLTARVCRGVGFLPNPNGLGFLAVRHAVAD